MSAFQTSQNFEYSFYIPRLRSNWDWKTLSQYFQSINIGKIARVDFTPIQTYNIDPTTKDFYFVNNAQMLSAFIHFEELYQNDLTQTIIREIETTGQYLWKFHDNNEFWYLKKCQNPVGYPIYNTAQLCELIRGLEEKNIVQQDQINQLLQRQRINRIKNLPFLICIFQK